MKKQQLMDIMWKETTLCCNLVHPLPSFPFREPNNDFRKSNNIALGWHKIKIMPINANSKLDHVIAT
jgi:hypothetical protein